MEFDLMINLPLIIIAALMAVYIAYSVKWFEQAKSYLRYAINIFVLAMMASMFVGATIYYLQPSFQNLWIAIGFNQLVMWIAAIPILSSLIGEERGKPIKRKSITTLIFLVLVNEFFMGWAFGLITQPDLYSINLMLSSPLTLFANVINSYWFIFPMGTEMILTTYLLKKGTFRGFLIVALFQALIMIFTPTAISSDLWMNLSTVVGSVVMTILFILILHDLYKTKEVNQEFSNYLLILFIIFAFMMGGIYEWMVDGNATILALSLIAEMSLYFFYIVNRSKFILSKKFIWLFKPWWVFSILVTSYVSMLFMGGAIDIVIYGKDFLEGITLAPLQGNLYVILANSLYNFIIYFIYLMDSAGSFMTMALWFGALVLLKIKDVKQIETKIRLILLVLAYVFYTIIPSYFLFSEDQLPSIPFLGYIHGIGSSGPVAPAFLIALAITYFGAGALSILFGPKWLCSVTCHIAAYYQGTFFDSLKYYNTNAKVAKKFATSRINKAYRVISNFVWIWVIFAAVLSYLNSVGFISLSLYNEDIMNFTTEFYFHFIVQILFILTPFVGVYSCVTTGSCHYGLFAQYVGKLGFFKLKVKSIDVCAKCPTWDCAKACPTSLTDMPEKFIEEGEFKSHKCIGCGFCISACPYDNEYAYDFRNWFKERFLIKSDTYKFINLRRKDL